MNTRPEYRIVSDSFSGFEVQKRVWWWPLWFQPRINTRHTVEEAEALAREFARREYRVVKYLGTLSSERTAPRVAP